jgi:hypothetical protein
MGFKKYTEVKEKNEELRKIHVNEDEFTYYQCFCELK